MQAGSVKVYRLLKAVMSAVVFLAVVCTLIQFELPSVQSLGENLQSLVAERQMVLEGSGEEAVLKQGWVYYNYGRYDEAQRIMEAAQAKDGNLSAKYCLGLIDLKYGRWEEAAAKLEQVASASPRHAATRKNLGHAYLQIRYFGKAREHLERAIEIDPVDEEARLLLAKTYLSLNKKEEAAAMLETVSHGRESREAAVLMKNLGQLAD